jgi:hypothetical protein
MVMRVVIVMIIVVVMAGVMDVYTMITVATLVAPSGKYTNDALEFFIDPSKQSDSSTCVVSFPWE